MKLDSFHTPKSRCTHCGRGNDSAMSVTADDAPRPGDKTVCIQCGHIMAFADDMTLRDLADQEMIDVAGDRNLLLIQRVLGEMHARFDKQK